MVPPLESFVCDYQGGSLLESKHIFNLEGVCSYMFRHFNSKIISFAANQTTIWKSFVLLYLYCNLETFKLSSISVFYKPTFPFFLCCQTK